MALTLTGLPDSAASQELLEMICQRTPVVAPRRVDKPLVLYGAGNLGRMAKEYFDRVGIPVLMVVDVNPSACYSDIIWKGITIVPPDDVSRDVMETSLLAVCVATAPYAPLAEFLRSSGWADVVPYYDIAEAYRSVHPLSNGWFSGTLGEEERSRIGQVLDGWDDDVSRAHHLQLLAWRTLREEWFFEGAPVTINDRYFIPLVKALLTPSEAFLDVGAHHGETTLRFLKEIDSHFLKVWAIEPDPLNLAVLQENLSKLPVEVKNRIHVLTFAIASWKGKGHFFDGLGYASQLTELGQGKIEVRLIDDLNVAPSYIKLHLEGSELDALNGATETLRLHRPIVAATSYHNALGIMEFPQWLMEILDNYRFFLRLHSWCGTGAVIYAVPQERFYATGTRQGDL